VKEPGLEGEKGREWQPQCHTQANPIVRVDHVPRFGVQVDQNVGRALDEHGHPRNSERLSIRGGKTVADQRESFAEAGVYEPVIALGGRIRERHPSRSIEPKVILRPTNVREDRPEVLVILHEVTLSPGRARDERAKRKKNRDDAPSLNHSTPPDEA
jgi:hypothetical protein